MTNNGYGILVDSTDNVSFEVASEKVEYVGFSVPGERIKYYLFHGPSPKKIMNEYTALTGRPALPPAWSFGLWLSTSFTTNYDEETTTSFIEGMEKRNIPLSVFHFDCFWMHEFHWCDFEWDKKCFPDIRATLKEISRQRSSHLCMDQPVYCTGNRILQRRRCKRLSAAESRRKRRMADRQLAGRYGPCGFYQPGCG